jgi:hypothetical protein
LGGDESSLIVIGGMVGVALSSVLNVLLHHGEGRARLSGALGVFVDLTSDSFFASSDGGLGSSNECDENGEKDLKTATAATKVE